MNPFKREEHHHLLDRELLYMILENQFLTHEKLNKIMSDATDLQTLVDQLKKQQDDLKTSLDSIQTGVATIVKGIPSGGMSAEDVAALKTSLGNLLDQSSANLQEAQADAAAVAAAQPGAEAPAQ